MNDSEKRAELKKLQEILLADRGKHKSNAIIGKGNKEGYSNNMWVIRKQIAIVKTSLNMKGFHYNPR